ncbi:MAG: STAS domain-containing protein [Gammaproteobacteria bacterium]|nr:STAS domain-containing protein [Gammaproteobacteria bacterium]
MNSGKILVATVDHVPILKFSGDVRVLMSSALDNYFSSLYQKSVLDRMIVDMTETQGIDSTALGLIAKMAIQLRNRFNVSPTIISTNPDITRILKSMSMDLICNIVENMDNKEIQFDELNQVNETEETVRQKVIEAHQTLMALSDENKAEFQDLISVLKADR